MEHQPSTQSSPAVQWAQTRNHPRLGDVERIAAQDIPALSEALEKENLQPQTTESNDGFIRVIEDWLLPVFGIAGLLVSAYLSAPASWFGPSISFSYTDRPASTFDIDTVNLSNAGSRLMVALLCGILALVLVVTTIVARRIRRNWRLATQFVAVLVVIGAAANAVISSVNARDGYGEFAIAQWLYLILTALGLVMAAMAFVGYRRGRVRAATGIFQSLPTQQQQALVLDRDQALDVLVQRGVAKPKDVARVKRMPFGEFTGQVNANREV